MSTQTSKTIVLISGANTGIGYEIAKKLAKENPTYHILMGSRNIEKGQAAATSLVGLSVEPIQLDVTSDESINACFETVKRKYQRLDVLINNAGIARTPDFEELSIRQRYTEVINTNSISAAVLTETFVPLLRKSENPRIVFISSGLGSIGSTVKAGIRLDAPEYKASKATMNMFVAIYAAKFPGFKVNACCPGYTQTGLTGGQGQEVSLGALNAVRLATLGKNGETGTFSHRHGTYPW